MKLGKRLGVVKDPRTLKLANYLTPALPSPPARVQHSRDITFEMLGNDVVGDCTVAAAANLERAWSRGRDAPNRTDVMARYFDLSGNQDTGLYVLDVLTAWANGRLVGNPIKAFAAVEPSHFHVGCWLFGGVYCGFALPEQVQGKNVWTDLTGEPGSWGGHAVPVVNSDRAGVTVVSWGRLYRVSWKFVDRYCDEAFCAVSQDWLDRRRGKSPQGFDRAALEADLASIRSNGSAAKR